MAIIVTVELSENKIRFQTCNTPWSATKKQNKYNNKKQQQQQQQPNKNHNNKYTKETQTIKIVIYSFIK